MFGFFKKNKIEKLESIGEKASAAALKEQINVDNIEVHVMPERFRNQPIKQHSAKTTGIIIIIGGAVFLIIISVALYYFLFKKTNVTINQEPSLVNKENQVQTQEEQSTGNQNLIPSSTASTTLPIGGEVATTTIATTTPENTSEETDITLSVGNDSDNDGLTDVEEIILSSSTSTPDTDGDGYLDGAEVMSLYNPTGTGKLSANPRIAFYENKTFSYDLLYPLIWPTSINGGDDSLMFKTNDNQFIQIIVQPNVNKQTLDDWYMEQLGVLAINETDRVSGVNWQGIKSPDGLNIYLMNKKQNYIFSLTYNPGVSNVLEYLNIFQMMVKSFNLKD